MRSLRGFQHAGEALAMMHRQLFREDESFYAEHAQHAGSALGLVCSGGTVANVSALWLARNALLRPNEAQGFAGVERQGFVRAMRHYGYEDAAVIGSQALHYSLRKAADVLGLGTAGMRLVPFDEHYRAPAGRLKWPRAGPR